jgi:NAD+ diphosphatase
VRVRELPMMARSVLDRAAHHRTDPAWLDQAWSHARVLLVSKESTTPVYSDGAAKRVRFSPSADIDATAERWFLGVDAEVPYFAVRAEPGVDAAEGESGWQGIRQFGPDFDALEMDALVTSVALTQWHLRHQRCPLCGEPTVITQAGWTRHCPVDRSDHFPRTDPAVIMLVHDGAGRCLLGRGAAWPAGRYSTLAGFVEPGESLESAVIREVYEEASVRVSDVQYVASQPWPFPSSLMLGFFARADSAAGATADAVEVLDAGWFTRADVAQAAQWTDNAVDWADTAGHPEVDRWVLRAVPPRFSISRFLIDEWLADRA